jgi:alpha-ribazole phosphatase/probable phosphoglycerate mutase
MRTEPFCRVYLIRHGEVANASEFRFNGHFDVELSPHGVEQISKVAAQLKDKPINAVYSSNLRRTHVGACIIAEPHGCAPITHPELREICMGKWEGLTAGEIESQFPGELEQRLKNVETFYTDQGESFEQLRGRVMPKLREIVNANMGKTIVIMAHGGVNRVILAQTLGIPAQNIFGMKQDYAAVNIIQFYQNTAIVELLNGSAQNGIP